MQSWEFFLTCNFSLILTAMYSIMSEIIITCLGFFFFQKQSQFHEERVKFFFWEIPNFNVMKFCNCFPKKSSNFPHFYENKCWFKLLHFQCLGISKNLWQIYLIWLKTEPDLFSLPIIVTSLRLQSLLHCALWLTYCSFNICTF